MSRSYKKYTLCKRGRGNTKNKRFSNKKVRNSKELKNNNHYRKFYDVEKYDYGIIQYTIKEYIDLWCDTYTLDELYKDWVTKYYFK